MKAALMREPGKPLEIADVATPSPGDHEILVKVAACGVCHTDLHYIDHGVPTFKKPPIILGHEVSGVVAALGKGVTRFKEGDHVLLPAVLTCGLCDFCRWGRENICANMLMFGNHIDGGFAEYVVTPAKDVLTLPKEMPLTDASIIADAVSTPYHAVVNRGKVKAGDRVAVFGCGGVGINVVQTAVLLGAETIAVDLDEGKLGVAKELGAAHVVNPRKVPKVPKQIREITGGAGVDVAFEAIGNPETIRTAYESVRRGGRVVIVGYSDKEVTISPARLMFFEIEMVGSLGCRPVDYQAIIRLAHHGRLKLSPLITGRFPLEKINEALDTLRKGRGVRNIVIP